MSYKNRKKLFLTYILVFLFILSLSYVSTVINIPGSFILIEGETFEYNFKSPFTVNFNADSVDIISINNKKLNEDKNISLSDPVFFSSNTSGEAKLNINIFNIFTIKKINVKIVPGKKVMACGKAVGLKLSTPGILVLDYATVMTREGEKNPAKSSGIKPGDLIYSINGIKTDTIEDLKNIVYSSKGNMLDIIYTQNNEKKTTQIMPYSDIYENKYRLGLWVRDSTAGIGTITFYDPETLGFGALGHGITDIDTGILMPSEKGEISKPNIVGIKKGENGQPGELKGIIGNNEMIFGEVYKNTPFGVYGKLYENAKDITSFKEYPIALRNQVRTGKAKILSDINGNGTQEYDIVIEKVSNQSDMSSKGIVIKVTDERLLAETGGIVQGMSGSPIIQNGKIIGAVTHVFVNDPTRGYGIFIEWMIDVLNQ